MSINEENVWEQLKKGDNSALSYIYFKYSDSMFHYGIRFHNSPDFIKDCIQDVFLKLIKSGEKLGSTENIQFYLFKALKNKIYKEWKKRSKLEQFDVKKLNFTSSFSLEEELLEKEDATIREKALLEALKNLSPRQREIIYLRFENNLNYNQICEIMDLGYDSARKLLYRAITSLKKHVENKTSIILINMFHSTVF